MGSTKRFISSLLTALLIMQLAFPVSAAMATEREGGIPRLSTALEQLATSSDTSVSAPASATDEPSVAPTQPQPAASAPTSATTAAEDRSIAATNQPVIEARLVSTDGKTNYGSLSDPKTVLSLPKGQQFKLRLHAVFPSASDKSIDVALTYGMDWNNSSFKFDTTAGWYGELQKDGIITPNKQTEDSKKPVSVYNWKSAGTLTLKFQDTTQEVTFDVPMGLQTYDTGLASISDAITVTQNYTKEGEAPTAFRLSADIEVTKRAALSKIGFGGDYSQLLNRNGNIEVGLDDSRGTGHNVSWMANLDDGWGVKRVLEDYFYAMLVPEKAEYLGRYSPDEDYGVKEADLKVLSPGEKFTMSTGVEYTVPAGKKLYVWERKDNITTPVIADQYQFNPMWRFPKKDFPVGSIAEISQFDVGVKYYDPMGQSAYLPYDASRLKTMRYEIVEPQEDVYANSTFVAKDTNLERWEGYIADNEVYLGGPGFEHTQERTLGYFTVGNRGTGNSRHKTIIIDYDVNDTKIAGVTAQALPLISRKKKDGTPPTQVSDFKVTLWNSKTDETTDYTIEASKLKQRFRVEDVLGKHVEGMYIKHIEYKIDTIPARTPLTAWGRSGTGKETTEEDGSLFFFGNVLTNEVREKGRWGDDPSLFKTVIRIENTGAEEPDWTYRNQYKWDFGDGKGEVVFQYPGRSADHVTIGHTFTAFTGKSFIQGHGPVTGWHNGTSYPLEFVVGDTIRDQYFSYFTPTWDGCARGIQTHKAMYYISPLGDDLSFNMTYRSTGSKDAWLQKGADPNNMSLKQPDVSEVPASDALKEVYPKAKVYKLDFSKLTSAQDIYDTRAYGPSVYWKESAEAIPYAINAGYWAYTADFTLHVSFASDPAKDVPGEYTQLMWLEYDTDTDEDLVYGSGMVKDKWDLNGNGSTEDMIGRPMGRWIVSAPTDLVVRSAAKMATQLDTSYVTYDGMSKTLIGANSTVDYRLVANNPTQSDANGLTMYWPVPKKDQNWGKALQPNGAFQFDLFLNGGLKSQLPEGYTISYAKNIKPTSQALDWDSFEWTDESNTASWTQEDWDAVNFVRISSPKDRAFNAGTSQEFKFNLTLRDVAPEDFEKKLVDVFTPAYLRDLGSGKGYRYGQPVAMTPTSGVLRGIAWVDADFDGTMDESEKAHVVSGVKLELYNSSGKLMDTAVTDETGAYEFKGLKTWPSTASGELEPYTIKAYNPTDPKSADAGSFVRFSPTKGDMVMTASDDQTTATVEGVSIDKKNATSLNIGLSRATKLYVKKVWVEGKNADGTDGTGITHDPVEVSLLMDGKAAKNFNNQEISVASLAGANASPWEASFTDLLVNNPATNTLAKYTVKETSVPEGYADSYTYETKESKDARTGEALSYTVATVTNTRIHGSIEISKTDKTDAKKLLPNATFELRKDGVKVREGTTNNKGVLTFTDIPYGDYTIVETAAPKGYLLDSTPQSVKIETQDQVAKVTFGDEQIKGTVTVTKTDSADQHIKLKGATFELRQGDKVVDTKTTGDNGVATFKDVIYGDYTVVETKAPEGYVLEQTAKPVAISENGKTVNVDATNAKIKGTVTVTKTDAQDATKTLAGATFELRQGDKVVDTQTTGDDGIATFKDVVYGDYTLVETKAPQGYELDQKPLSIKIEKDKVLLKFEVKNATIPAKTKPVIGILPKTGDANSSIVPVLFVSAASAAFAWVLRKKRKQS